MSLPRAFTSPFRAVFDQTDPANRALTRGLALYLTVVLVVMVPIFATWSLGVDLEIPLRAADRWSNGGLPYLASSFNETSGAGLPFLYPPWLLPIVAPFAALPRTAVLVVWLAACVAIAVWTCRRLSVPWIGVPFVLAWAPFAEGLVTGNVQLLQFAAFAALFYVPGRPWELRPRPATTDAEPRAGAPAGGSGRAAAGAHSVTADLQSGLLAFGVGALKYTQLLPLVWLLRPRPRAAIFGGVALVLVAVAMLPFTGIAIYRDWVDQLGRASDPAWSVVGAPLAAVIGRPLSLVAAVAAVLALFVVRGRDAGAWVGIALLVVAPSIHGYGMLFLLPALLTIRRDIALALAVLVTGYNPYAWWISIAVAAVAMAASNRYPALRAPTSEGHDVRRQVNRVQAD